jgi:hypothetical protein
MANKEARKMAAKIISEDMDIITAYWRERNEQITDDEFADQIQSEMDELLSELLLKCRSITKR